MPREWIRFPAWGQVAVENVVHAVSRTLRTRTVCGRAFNRSGIRKVARVHPGEVCIHCATHPGVIDA